MVEGDSFLEEHERIEFGIASGREVEGSSRRNSAMSEPFNLAKNGSFTSSFELLRSFDAPSRMASVSSDAYSNVGAGCSSLEIDLPGGFKRMPGSPFVTPIGNPHPNIQQSVKYDFREAEITVEARIRVLEAHVLALQAENVDLHRRMSLMESMSSRDGPSPVPRDHNSASKDLETVMNHVANRCNPPIESPISGVYRHLDRRDSHVDAHPRLHDSSIEFKFDQQGKRLESSLKGHVLICQKEHKYPFIVNGATKREVEIAEKLPSTGTEVVKLEKDAASSHLQDQMDRVVREPLCEGGKEMHVVGRKLEGEEQIGHEIHNEVGAQLGGAFNLEVRNIFRVELDKTLRHLAAKMSNTSDSFMATGGNFKTNPNDNEEGFDDVVRMGLQSMVTDALSKFFDSQEQRLEVIKNRLNYHEDLLEYANDCTDYSDHEDNSDTSRAQFTRSRIESLKGDERPLGAIVQPGDNILFQTPICKNIIQSYGPFSEAKGEGIEKAIQHDFDAIMGVDQKETCELDSSAHTIDYDFDRITGGETHEQAENLNLKCIVDDDSPLLSITLPTSQPACIDALEGVIYISGSSPFPLGPSATSPGVSKKFSAPAMNSQISGLETDVNFFESHLDGGIETWKLREDPDGFLQESPGSGDKSRHAPGSREYPLHQVSLFQKRGQSLTGTGRATNAAINACLKELKELPSPLVKDQSHEAMQEEIRPIPDQLHSLESRIPLLKPGGQSVSIQADLEWLATTMAASKKPMLPMISQVSDLQSRIECLEKHAHPATFIIQSDHAAASQHDLTASVEEIKEASSFLVNEHIHEEIKKEVDEMRCQIHFLHSRIDQCESGSQSDPASTCTHLEAPTASEGGMKEPSAPAISDPTSCLKSPDAATNYDSSANEVKAFIQAEVEKSVGLEVRQMHAMIMMQINSRIELLESGRQSGPVPTRPRPKLPASYSRIPPTPMNFRMVAPPSLAGNPELLERHFQLELEELVSTQVACFETRMSSRMDRLEYRMSCISLSLSNLWQNVWNLGASIGGWNTWALGMGVWNPV